MSPVPLALARAARRRGSAILALHGVGAVAPGSDPELLCMHPAQFRAHVEMLSAAGYEFVTVKDYLARGDSGDGAGAIAITFDDGLANLVTGALPILRELNAPATVFVPTGLIGEPYPWAMPASGLRIASEDELGELAAAGWELGAHTVNHRDLSVLGYEECVEEMAGSREALERLTGGEVVTFAYPYARYSEDAKRAARDVGFLAALSYSMLADGSRFALSRELLTPQHGPGSLALKLLGRYDRVMTSTPGRVARRLTRRIRTRPHSPLRPRT